MVDGQRVKLASARVLWLFAVGQLGWSILQGIISNWLVYYYQPGEALLSRGQQLFVTQGTVFAGLTIIGLITASGRVFDAVTDPLVGSLSDRCRSRLGRRIPFMRYSALPFGLVTVLVFVSPVDGVSWVNAVCLFLAVLGFYLAMTCYCTPYNALIPELGRTQRLRINVSTYISTTYFIGTAMAYLVSNVAGLFEPTMGPVASFRLTVAIMACVAVACMLVPAFAIRERDYAPVRPSTTPAMRSLARTYANREFRTFVASDVLYWIALTMFQTGLPFYITELMGMDDSMAFPLFALMTAVSLAFYAPVNLLAKRVGKKRLVVGAFLFFSLAFAVTSCTGTLGLSGLAWGVIVAVMAAVPMAVLGILPQAVVADIAEADAARTGERREGMFYAARTFAFKLGQSVSMLLFTSLSLVGGVGGVAGQAGYRLTAVVAAAFCLAGGLVFTRYHERDVLAQQASAGDRAAESGAAAAAEPGDATREG